MIVKQALIGSKGQLGVILSKLKGFNSAKVRVEQYITDSEIASQVLWEAFLKGDIRGKVIADFGCGTGILGLGTMLLEAKQVYFVENDAEALEIAKQNYMTLKSEFKMYGKVVFEPNDIAYVGIKADLVVQNPPFGTKSRHADRKFLEKAFETADVVYSFHKLSTKGFVEAFAKDKNFVITNFWKFDFPIKAIMPFHEKRIQRIKVGCWRFEKPKTI